VAIRARAPAAGVRPDRVRPARRGHAAALAPPGQLSEAGFDPIPDIGARLRLFLDAYGLADRRAILPALQRSQLDSST
jgi:hypothetical protein